MGNKHYNINMQELGVLVGNHLSTGASYVSTQVHALGVNVIASVEKMPLLESVKKIVSEIEQTAKVHSKGIEDSMQMFGHSYKTSLSQSVDTVSRALTKSQNTWKDAIVKGQTILGEGFRETGLIMSNAFNSSSRTMTNTMVDISTKSSIEITQTLGILILLLIPVLFFFLLFVSREKNSNRVKSFGYASIMIVFVCGSVFIAELAISTSMRKWILNPNQYLLFEFLCFLIASSTLVLFYVLCKNIYLCLKNCRKKKELVDMVVPDDISGGIVIQTKI